MSSRQGQIKKYYILLARKQSFQVYFAALQIPARARNSGEKGGKDDEEKESEGYR